MLFCSIPHPARKTVISLAVLTLLGTACRSGLAQDTRPADSRFKSAIRPLLEQHCVDCHNGADPQSGLNLSSIRGIQLGGDHGPLFVAGQSQDSLLIKVLEGQGEIARMPKDSEPLTPAQIALIKQWIDAGAALPEPAPLERRRSDHWSFQPIRRPAVPVEAGDAWCRNEIDAFILRKLRAEGLEPSPRTTAATLARRAALDITGLLPPPDRRWDWDSPAEYRRYVDHLLASPAYGERWGRHWLDAARYADSNGFTIDSGREIWKYRDWVIHALNANLPFDQFVIEQLAGDLLPDARTDQIVATGFHRNTLINEEGGTDQEQFRVEAVVDRVNTTGTVFLGLTVGCAQCHSHKYDPITQREYYQLLAFFNSTDEYSDSTRKFPVPTPAQRQQTQQLQQLRTQQAGVLKQFDDRHTSQLAPWIAQVAATADTAWEPLTNLQLSSERGSVLTVQDSGAIFVDFSIPPTDTFLISSPTPSAFTAIRLEALTHDSLPQRGPGRAGNGNFVLSEFRASVEQADGTRQPIKFARAVADHSQSGYPISEAIDGRSDTGWAINVKSGSLNVDRQAIFVAQQPVKLPPDATLRIELEHAHRDPKYLLGLFRLSLTSAPAEQLGMPEPIVQAARIAQAERTPEQSQALLTAFLQTLPERAPLLQQLTDTEKKLDELQRQIPTTYVMRELSQPRESHIHIRGDFLRQGARVLPDVPQVLPPLETSAATEPTASANRLQLAHWLMSADNPLTARVTVNRIWQRYFGLGLVETENDFGLQGTPPSHPELLDWLALELIESGWDVKHVHRCILTSATYQQSSRYRADTWQIDPRNRLLARQNRLRLEAESIRDVFLSASGLLTERLGGPSFHPPQPEGIYVLTQQKKQWPESQGAERYRRGLYIKFWRSSPYPYLPTFDAPNANQACTRRSRSNTPMQALTLANDPAFLELIQGLAGRIHQSAESDPQRLQRLFRACLLRDPQPVEQQRLQQYLGDARRHYAQHPAQVAQLAGIDEAAVTPETVEQVVWFNVARVVTNLDEFITRE